MEQNEMLKNFSKVVTVLFIVLLASTIVVLFAEPSMVEANYTGTNLTPIPTGWQTSSNGMIYAVGGSSWDTFDASNPYGGVESVKISPPYGASSECDGSFLTISPGEHIVFICWMKTTSSTIGDNGNPQAGVRIGIDMYGNTGRITGIATTSGGVDYTPENGWTDGSSCYVEWNTPTWTEIIMDFTV